MKNIEAINYVMDLSSVKIRCLLSEIDAWKNICMENDVIKSLHFKWDPQCDSLSEKRVKSFFEHLIKHDEDIEDIKLEFFHGEIKAMNNDTIRRVLYPQFECFRDYVGQCIEKRGLNRLSIQLYRADPYEATKDDFSNIVHQKIAEVFEEVSSKLKITELHLDMDIGKLLMFFHYAGNSKSNNI